MTKRAAKALAATRREPTTEEAAEGKAAAKRVVAAREGRENVRASLPRLEATWSGTTGVKAPHSDANGWSAQMVDALGLNDGRVANFILSGALNAGFGAKPTDAASAGDLVDSVEHALAFVAEAQPKGPIETALVLQMAAAHSASMTLARHGSRADQRDSLGDFNRMMNQTMRTFAAQVEAFHKLRAGGKQQVEVRHVYVDARTQTVVNAGGGHGGANQIGEQPHAPAGVLGYAPAPGLPVWSADPSGDALPVASDTGASAVPDARRAKSGRSTRRGQRELRGRPLDAGNNLSSGERPGVGQNVQGDAA